MCVLTLTESQLLRPPSLHPLEGEVEGGREGVGTLKFYVFFALTLNAKTCAEMHIALTGIAAGPPPRPPSPSHPLTLSPAGKTKR